MIIYVSVPYLNPDQGVPQMDVYVTLRPFRTREHSKTPDDFVNDFYVPRTAVEDVSLDVASATMAGQRLLSELYDDIPGRHDTPYQLTKLWAVWKGGYGHNAHNAITAVSCPFEGDPTAKTVHVLLKEQPYRAWNGETYVQLWPLRVFSDAEEAKKHLVPGVRITEAVLQRGRSAAVA